MFPDGVLKQSFVFGLATVVACALSIGSLVTNAQLAGASLSGQVSDPSGAVVVAANIVIKNNATGEVRTVTTNAKGLYSAQNLPPSIYSISVSAPGFATHLEQGVELTVGGVRELDLSLTPGEVTQTIDVKAGASDVETDTSMISATVEQKRIVDLPLNGRDWTQLATLQPGVASVRPQQPTTGDSNRGVRGYGNQLATNGHSPYENTYRLDGINENDYSNGAPGNVIGANLGVDAIQEFSVVTTSYTAAYGRTSGSVINAVTRSGTNDLHGSAYVFDRDKIFDARNFFDGPKIPPFHRVQFGAAAGGPIRKNHTFLFANYEGVRQSQSQDFSNIVPSAAARSGQLHLSDGTPVTITVDPKIIPFLGLYPLPNAGLNPGTFGDTGIFNTSGLLNLDENFFLTRFDQTFSEQDRLSITYMYDNGPETIPDSLGNTLSRLSAGRQLAGITETHIFSPHVVNIVRIGYNRSLGEIVVPIRALTPAAGDPALGYTPGTFAPAISVDGIAPTGGLGNLRQAAVHYNSYQFDDDVAILRGTHSITTGFAFEQIFANAQGKNQNGTATFNPDPSNNITGLQNFLTNNLSSAFVLPNGTTNPVEAQDSLFGGYIQDDWRVRKNLTLNLGLRYEMLTIPTDRANRLGLVTELSAASGTGPCPAVISPTSVPGCVVPVSKFWQTNPTTHNFEPRIGFAYSPFGSGKTAIRGGFGIYDMLPLPYIYATYATISAPYSLDEIAVGVPQGSFPDQIAGVAANFASFRIGHYIEPHPKRTYSLNYNANIEQQLSKTLSAMIGYVGSHTLHTAFQASDMNQVAPSNTQVIDGRRIWPSSGGVPQDANSFVIFGLLFDGAAHYNSLLTQLKVRDYHGLNAQGAYTWNQCTDLGSSTQSPGTYQNSIDALIYFDKVQRKGMCDFDLTQSFSLNAIYELPSPAEGWMKALAGGWQLGGIVTASTGVPFTLLQAGDVLGQQGTSFGAFPDVVPNCNPINGNFKSSGLNYINSNCFVFPTVPTGSAIAPLCNQGGTTPIGGEVLCLNIQGNERRNQLIGPRLVDVDLSLIKNIRLSRISESFNLQLRVEAFNVFNHTNFQAPTNNNSFGGQLNFNQVSPGTAGLLDSTATSSRQLQFGAKLIF
jgi:hypothetical protein